MSLATARLTSSAMGLITTSPLSAKSRSFSTAAAPLARSFALARRPFVDPLRSYRTEISCIVANQ